MGHDEKAIEPMTYPVFSPRRLAQLRKQAGLTQEQLADASDGMFTSNAVRHWEQGRRTPGFDYIARIAYLIDAPLSAFTEMRDAD